MTSRPAQPEATRRRRAVRAYAGLACAGVAMVAGIVALGPVPSAGAAPPPGAIVVGTTAGPNCPTPTAPPIQPVINAAAAGSTIFICAGVYTEQLTINKPLTLLGAQFGQDARTGRTNAASETVFDVPTGAVVYTTGATTGTLDGFTLQDADGAAVFGVNNVGAQAYTFQNNIITGNQTGLNFQTVGPAVTLISQNRFVANNKATGPNSGTSILITNGPVTGMTVQNNLFQGNTGSAAADINTPGGATPSTGITLTNNVSIDDDTFAVINFTAGTNVLNNTITHTSAAATSGTAILLFNSNTDAAIAGNTINGGTATGVADFSGSSPSGNVTVAQNTITNRGFGIRLSQANATVRNNVIGNSSQVGIWMQAASSGGAITGNNVSSNQGVDCRDDSIGGGTAGTANTWGGNTGLTSTPAGLCLAAAPPATAPPGGGGGSTTPTTTTSTTSSSTTTTTSTTSTTASTGTTAPGGGGGDSGGGGSGGGDSGGGTTTVPSGQLPVTGGPAALPMVLMLGALLLVGGGTLLLLRRTLDAT